MCIIAYKAKYVPMWDDQTIKTMFKRNPDGAGVMYAEDGAVHIDKGFMTADDLLDYLHSRDFTEVPLFLHCRIGTSGGNTRLNCHPYPVGKRNACHTTCDVGFMHNGVMHEYNPPKGSHLNDTQVFKNTVLNHLPADFMEYDGIVDLLEISIGMSNRLAFLRGDGETLFIGRWVTEGEYLYSNQSYKEYEAKPWYQTHFSLMTDKKQKSTSFNDYYDDISFWDDLEDDGKVIFGGKI